MNSFMRIIVLSIFLQGCSSIEEGEVDYVKTLANNAINSKTKANCSSELYSSSEYTRAGVTRECYETLYRKYTKAPEISKGDTVSVHLMQAFNGFAKESRNPYEFFTGAGSNAEIVVIANVCEQGISGCSLRFGPESDKSGRVIYFSNGVKANQYLNFSYLPVYGPIKYDGGPLIIQISILEIDSPSEQQKNLLTTLAAAGKKAYPPASAALSVLDKVGGSLLAGSSDDIIFRYTMSLVPDSSDLNFQSPIIAEGNYAFIRKNTWSGALEKEETDELKFDNLTGRLVKKCNSKEQKLSVFVDDSGIETKSDYNPCTLDLYTGSNYKDYRDNTYLTFQIKSGFAESTLDHIQTFESLLTEINTETDTGALKVITAFSELKEEVSRNAQQKKILKQIENVKKSLTNIPQDTLGLYNNQVYQLYGEFNQQVNQYTNLQCQNTPQACLSLMNGEQLMQIQLEMRSLLNLINPTISPILSIPLGYTKLNASFLTEFEKGYQLYFNDTIFQRYLGNLESIQNLATNIDDLKNENAKVEHTQSRQILLKSEAKDFLNQLSKGLSLSAALSCNGVHASNCYRYLTAAQITQVITIFNQFALNYGVQAADLLTNTAKTPIENLKIIQTLIVLQ